jgi:hypothetical protein
MCRGESHFSQKSPLANVGESGESGQSRLANVDECIESDLFPKAGLFVEYSNSPNLLKPPHSPEMTVILYSVP